MSAADDMRRANAHLQKHAQELFAETAQLAFESIQVGSALTGAPGQPVDTGALRASWQLSFPSRWKAFISTNIVYAPAIEHGIGPHGFLKLRSQVGGFHSVELTEAGLPNIVRFVHQMLGDE